MVEKARMELGQGWEDKNTTQNLQIGTLRSRLSLANFFLPAEVFVG
jgi:hypothetical protein